MKKLYLYQGTPVIKEVEVPATLPNWVLVKTAYSFISAGTERKTLDLQAKNLFLRFYDNMQNNMQKVAQLVRNEGLLSTFYQLKGASNKLLDTGYACAGEVIWADASTNLAIGDLVACAGAGFAGHAEVVAVPKNLTVKLPQGTDLKNASACAIAAVAMQALRQADCQLGERLLVQGLGLVGLMLIQLAKAAGLEVIGIDCDPQRLKLATELGCQQVFAANDVNLPASINFLTKQHGVDAVVVCASSQSNILDQALELVRKQGKVVVVGDVPLRFEREHFYHKEVQLLASCSYGPGRYEQSYEKEGLDYPLPFVRWTEQRNLELCAQLIATEKLQIKPLISNTLPFAQATDAFALLKTNAALGIVLEFDSQTKHAVAVKAETQVHNPINFLAIQHRPNIAVVGAGGFAKTRLIPELLGLGNNCLYAVVDPASNNLVNIATQFNIAQRYASLDEALKDPAIDLFVISSPHGEHFAQTLQVLQHGKAVFVEKPPVVNLNELHSLSQFLANYPQAFYAIDFNRVHSPYFNKIKTALDMRVTPLMMEYRVNAGFLAPQHWIFAAQNNGRIVGEACHMVDFLVALTGSHVVALNVSRMDGPANQTKDNFSATLNFADNSQANLIYTSLGNQTQDKERVEIFWQGSSIVLRDFCQLEGFGTPFWFNKSSFGPDKGHKQSLQLFLLAIKKQRPELLRQHTKRALHSMLVTLLINDLVNAGGGFVKLANIADLSPLLLTLG